jgi:hypothetical protein
MSEPKTERVLIANDARGVPVILATDGELAGFMCREVGTGAEDAGIAAPARPGLFVFEGHGRYEASSHECPNDRDLVWYGELRPVRPEEVAELFAMTPPEPEDKS